MYTLLSDGTGFKIKVSGSSHSRSHPAVEGVALMMLK